MQSDQISNIESESDFCRYRFWKRAASLTRPGSPCLKHFVDTSEAYLTAVTREAEDRANQTVHSIKDYLTLRRDTCGARPTLALIEFGLDLPEEVTSHPVLVSLREAAVDLIILVNVSLTDRFSSACFTDRLLLPRNAGHALISARDILRLGIP